MESRLTSPLTLDTLTSSALYWLPVWSPELSRDQSWRVLRLVLSKLFVSNRGALFHARMRCSHAGLAEQLSLSREWACKLIARLRVAGWITTEAPRRPDGKQEISTFRPGRKLKRLLVMLLNSKQRFHKNRVNDASQKLPSKEQIEKNKTFLAELRQSLLDKMSPAGQGGAKRW